MWEELDHPADILIEVWADSYKDLMLEAGIAFSELTTNTEEIETTEEYHIDVAAEELDLLLVEFLQELLYLLETEDFVATSFKAPQHFPDKDVMVFSVTAKGGKWEQDKHESRAEIKAVTFHELEVRAFKSNKWKARVLFDI